MSAITLIINCDITRYHLQNYPTKEVPLLAPYYREENYGSEKSSALPNAIQLVHAGATDEVQFCLTPKPQCSNHIVTASVKHATLDWGHSSVGAIARYKEQSCKFLTHNYSYKRKSDRQGCPNSIWI